MCPLRETGLLDAWGNGSRRLRGITDRDAETGRRRGQHLHYFNHRSGQRRGNGVNYCNIRGRDLNRLRDRRGGMVSPSTTRLTISSSGQLIRTARFYREEPFTPVVAGQFCARSGRSLQRAGQAGRKNTTTSVEWEVWINGRTKYPRWT